MYIIYTGTLYTQVHYIHRYIMYTGTMCTYYVHRYIVHLPNEGRNEIYLDWHCEINKCTLELISSFSRPGLVKFNKIYIEKIN